MLLSALNLCYGEEDTLAYFEDLLLISSFPICVIELLRCFQSLCAVSRLNNRTVRRRSEQAAC